MTPSIGERIQILKTGPHDPACMEIINELLDKLYTARAGLGRVVGEAVMAKMPLDRMGRMLEVGWQAAVESDIYD